MIGFDTSPELELVITFSTPPGRPASSRICATASALSGVAPAGFSTIVQPAATAGPILRVAIAAGKFQGVIRYDGPDRLLHHEQPPLAVRRDLEAAVDAHRLLREPAEELRRVGDLGLRLGDRLAHLERHQQREVVGALDHQLVGAAQDLAALARRVLAPRGLLLVRPPRAPRSASSGVASATSAIVSPVEGSSTAKVRRRPRPPTCRL